MTTNRKDATEIEVLPAISRVLPRHGLMIIIVFGYIVTVGAIIAMMATRYRSQVEFRLLERTVELEVAYDTVISTISATPELFYRQIAADPEVTGLVAAASSADITELPTLHDRLLAYLWDDYQYLQQLDFRQLHFHLADNRSFVRFHRPDRFGDDLTEVRATVRTTNRTGAPTYGFEEGRIFNGFRFVFPLFHQGQHVGSVEASMNYKAIITRMNGTRPGVSDFVLKREIVVDKVFAEEHRNYETTLVSDRFVRETAESVPETSTVLGVPYSSIVERCFREGKGVEVLEASRSETIFVTVDSVPIAVSFLPIANIEGTPVASLIRYTELEEIASLRSHFFTLGAILVVLSGLVVTLLLWIERQRERLVVMSIDLRRTIYAKDRFFSIISHDLRGPVGALSSLTEMLADDIRSLPNVPPATREMADAVADGSKNTFGLVSDLLDLSRSQRGDIAFHPEELPIRSIVDEEFSALNRMATEKRIGLSCTLSTETVYADRYMLKTVLRNLVSNAIKFTPEDGSISVTAETHNGCVIMTITDTGVGMTAQQQSDVFDVATKSSTPGTRSESGTGLGLIVCREFVQKHGGKLTIDSELGVGTSFHVSIPSNNPAEG